jgi:hypothetical protein
VSELRFYDELGAELEQAAQRPHASRRPRLWATLGASGAALTGGIVAAVLLLSAGTPAAYAGWSRVPTTPRPSVLETAVHRCYKVGSDNAQLALPAPGGTMQPVLAEARGASAAAIYVVDSQVYMCLTVNESAFTSVDSYLMGPSLRTAPGPDQLSIPYGVSGGSGRSGPTHPHPLSPAQLRKLRRQQLAARRSGSPFGSGDNFALGQAGSDVSAVTFAFANTKTVVASIEHGWYFAWWPWMTEPTSVTVTTSTGTTTSPMGNSPHDGFGLRPYPACQPGSSSCVFATSRPAAPAKTTTSTGTTTTPTTSRPAGTELATATRECDAFTLTYSVMSADAFAGPPILTEAHGNFTALLNVTDGRVDLCLVGGDQKDFHAFFAWHIQNDGRMRVAPGPDQLSVPYAGDNGVGGGRVAPSLEGEPAGLRHRRPGSLAYPEYMQGGGYGPYVLGQAGSDVSAVSFTFADGKTVAATVANGWYFAWWPWISAPTSVTVATTSGTTTSPVTSSSGLRVTVMSGCQPGSSGCVFVTTPVAPSQTTTTTTTTTATP